jgi:predicted RNA-binding protein associated with RNAse of E/G family
MTITRDDPRFWDVRTLERRLRKGQITKKDYEKHLKSLDDVAAKQAPIELSDDDDDDDDEPDSGANGVHTD